MALAPLAPGALHTRCDPASLGVANSAELADLDTAQIHGRAVEAIRLGLDIPHGGYNLYLLGEAGSGRHAIIGQLLEAQRRQGPPPSDWCYVNNFADSSKPGLLRLPCGRGARLRDDMQHFVEELTPAISAVFQSDEYRGRIEAMQEEEKQRELAAVQALGDESVRHGIALLKTPHGFAFVPLKDDHEATLSQHEYEQLPPARQAELAEQIKLLHERMHKLMGDFPRWRRELQTRLKQTGSEALRVTVIHLIDDLRPQYADLPAVCAFLDAVLADISASGESLRESTHAEGDTETTTYSSSLSVQRYLVNLLVEHPADGARPVIHEDHPTLQNLVGRVEHVAHMGTLLSNFTLIRAGALQRANGGFLVLDALKVLSQPYAWDGLKRCLKAGQIRIESLYDLIGLSSTVQLEPEPMPLDLKVVLVGERLVYYLLCQYDPEFAALFKINADLESEIARDPGNTLAYARLIATLARRERLRPLSAAAVARLIEHSARLAEDAERLSARIRPLTDLMREAGHFAAQAASGWIERGHVEAALQASRRRNERIRLRHLEAMLRGQLLIDSSGRQTGQVNGLAVVLLDDSSFGHPVRITATVRAGEGQVLDIEREVRLGGPVHSKGVLILSSFLAARFGARAPLSLKASLVFEQSYGGIEGDSASLAELCALLSALSGAPIRQSLAVTGSVNQLGRVQPIGGVNEKIEGFYELCAARGLSGEQGVLIPAANVCQLMLREEVVEAARAGRFRIWAVEHVDQALELLTGLPTGTPDAQGRMAPGSVNARVAARLAQLAPRRRTAERTTTRPATKKT